MFKPELGEARAGNTFRSTPVRHGHGDKRTMAGFTFGNTRDGVIRELTTSLFLQKLQHQDATFIRTGLALVSSG